MAWDWVRKSARKAAELGAEYLQHSDLIDRLSKLPPETAPQEFKRTWEVLDERARAGFKMVLGALIVKQQAIVTSDGQKKLQQLLSLRSSIDPTGHAATPAEPASWSQTIARARDRVTALVDKAGAMPRGEMFAALRRELDTYRPQVEAKGVATWNALTTRLNALAARAEAMGQDPEAKAALAAFRDAMVAALVAHTSSQAQPLQPSTQANPVAESRAALETYASQPSPDPDVLMALARRLRDTRQAADDFSDEELGGLADLDTEYTASPSIAHQRRRAAVQRRIAISFANAAAGGEVVPPVPPSHDDQVEALMDGASALGALGVSACNLLQNMVDAALRKEREAGALTETRQKAYAHLAVSLKDAKRITDAAVLADRCWVLADELLSLSSHRPSSLAADLTHDDETARKLAQLEQLEQELERTVAEGKMTSARAATYRAQIAEAQAVTRAPQGRDSEDVVYKSRLKELLDRQLESMEGFVPLAGGTRAQLVNQVTGRLQSLLLKELTAMSTTSGERETADALGVRVFEAQRVAEGLNEDVGALELEVETLRRVAAELRQFQRRNHLTLINPPWASPETRTEASGVFCAVGDDLLQLLSTVTAEKRLKLLPAGASGKDPAQDAWNRLRTAAIAVFDLREHEPFEAHRDLARAARVGSFCYELGIAYCLGVPVVIVTRVNQGIPFDLDLTPVGMSGDPSSDRAALGDAIDEALYGIQRVAAGDSVAATLDYFLRTWGHGLQDGKQRDSVAQMKIEAGADAITSARLIGYGISLIKGNPPTLAYPILPGRYPNAASRCFIVMPFRAHVADGYRLIAGQCRKADVVAIRGDATSDQQILRSIWDELGYATHVTVDLTDFNPNVCLELGIADTLGRATFLIGRPGTEKALFPSLAKRRLNVYTGEAANDKAVREALARFLTGARPAAAATTSASVDLRPAPVPPPAPPPVRPTAPPVPTAPPLQTIGGLWSGVLRSGSDTMETTIRISPSGRTMYCYRDTGGYSEVELAHSGQRIQYVPPGGGVVTVEVQEVSRAERACAHLISWSFERAANGYMDQQYQRIAMQCKLQGDKLAVTYAETSETYMSDLSMMLGGDTKSRLFKGLLERARQ